MDKLNKQIIIKEIEEYYTSKGVELKLNLNLYSLDIDIFDEKHGVAIIINTSYFYVCNKRYFQSKTLIAEEHGLKLYQIWEHDWLFSKNKVLMMLDNLFGLSIPIFARKCKIKEISSKDKNMFLDLNHFQGADNSSIKLGLFYNDELVSCMTFCRSRFNKKYDWELMRFCNKAGCRVIGGAGKLFKHFVENYKPKNMISYSNMARTTGNLYKQLGFELKDIADPNYVWINEMYEFKTRYQSQMVHERIIRESQGYIRCYDSGNKVWVIDFTRE